MSCPDWGRQRHVAPDPPPPLPDHLASYKPDRGRRTKNIFIQSEIFFRLKINFVYKLKYFHDLKYFCENILQSTLEVNQISRESKLIFQRQLCSSMRASGLIVQQRSGRGTAASFTHHIASHQPHMILIQRFSN